MRRNSHHMVRSTDAVAPTLEGCWAYSPVLDCWEYILWLEPGVLHCMNEHGDEYNSHRAVEIEGLSPVKVDGVNPENYVHSIGYVRAMSGWSY